VYTDSYRASILRTGSTELQSMWTEKCRIGQSIYKDDRNYSIWKYYVTNLIIDKTKC